MNTRPLQFKESKPKYKPKIKSHKHKHEAPKTVKYGGKKKEVKFPGMHKMSGMTKMSKDLMKGLNLNISNLK